MASDTNHSFINNSNVILNDESARGIMESFNRYVYEDSKPYQGRSSADDSEMKPIINKEKTFTTPDIPNPNASRMSVTKVVAQVDTEVDF